MYSVPTLALAGLSVLLSAASFPIQADEMMARRNACMSCHQVERKMVGPSFRSIAERHAGQDGAAGLLAQKIVHGSQKAWGPIPMPANPRISDADARQLSGWILSLAPQK